MDCTCADSAIEQLSKLLSLPRLTSTAMKNQVRALLVELRFVKMFFCYLATLKPPANQEFMRERSVELASAQATLEVAGSRLYQAGYFASFGLDIQEWELLMSNLLETVRQLKPQIKGICHSVLVHESQEDSNPKLSWTNEVILDFVDSIVVNLERLLLIVTARNDVVISNHNESAVPFVKKQIGALKEKLSFTRNFIDFTTKRCKRSYNKLNEFSALFQAWTRSAAGLSLVYWVEVDSVDQNMADRMNTLLSESLQKIMPYNPRVTQMYLDLLKDSKISRSNNLLVGDIIAGFADFLLPENLVGSMEGDGIEMVREGLIFSISFLVDPPKELQRGAGRNAYFRQIEAALSKVTSLISVGDNSFVPGFLEKIQQIMTQVRKHHVQLPNSPASSYPKTDGVGFIHFLLTNLKDMMTSSAPDFVLFAKPKFVAIHWELHSLALLLKDIMDLQNEYEYDELQDLWTQTINVAYRAQDVISSCSIVDRPIWYHLICLSDVLEEMKIIKTAIGNVKREEQASNIGSSNDATSFNRVQISSRTDNSRIDGVILDFNDVAGAVINRLTRGSLELSIVSIVGMSGIGKTTLAKIAYNDPSVKLHFYKLAWCSVSQTYTSRDLLVDILNCIAPVEDIRLSNMSAEELAQQVRRCLLKQRYLVVLDDIWEIEAWNAVRDSLPRGCYGSRVVLTSQNHNLAMQTGLIHNTYPLSVLTAEQSWKLLQEMLFHNHSCPRHLLDVGKRIARNCKGLPLAIAIIAVLLRSEERNLDRWKQIEESLDPVIASKGYRGLLELSYNHLPDHLKPCFLYFGSFRAGNAVSARKLTLLWIAEGFIQRNEMGSMESLEVLADEYLMELINRSLVDVTKRSSDGGIKECRVHDLFHNFCIEKAQEERFLHVDCSDISHGSSIRRKYYPYRLCINSKWDTFMHPKPIGQHLYSLLLPSEIIRNQSHLISVAYQYFRSFKQLHILNLEGIHLEFSFPKEIISIVHLRYLAIRGAFMRIPSTIANLWNLRTLVVKGSNSLIRLPETIWKISSLKHVKVSEKAVISLGDHDLEDSSPSVSNMKTFSTLFLHHIVDTEKLLKRLSGLQKLKCVVSGSQLYKRNGIQFPALAYLQNLQSLTLCTVGYQGLQSCGWTHIQSQTFNFPSTLKKLTLYRLGLPWKAISIIRKLPNLEVLKLRDQAFRGRRWDMKEEDQEFGHLKFLELSNLNIEQWNVAYDPFPDLEHLVVGDCHRLEEIPDCFARITTLQKIELRRCRDRVKRSATAIVEEQRVWGNDELELHVVDS